MKNIDKYKNAFIETFNVKKNEVCQLTYQSTPAWDSVGHMNLITALEENFDIMFETDDIVDFNSYEKGIEILKKNGVEI